MKVLTFYIICGLLATIGNCNDSSESDDSSVSETYSSSSSSSEYMGIWSKALSGLNSLLNSVESNEKSNNNCDETADEEEHDEDENDKDDDEHATDLNIDDIESIFGETVKKLEALGEGALNDFVQELNDLIDAFVNSEYSEESEGQNVVAEQPNLNQQTEMNGISEMNEINEMNKNENETNEIGMNAAEEESIHDDNKKDNEDTEMPQKSVEIKTSTEDVVDSMKVENRKETENETEKNEIHEAENVEKEVNDDENNVIKESKNANEIETS